ncbi:MAG TPA: hypothetical protein VH081_00615 [Solirubrobacteraceae bacterium]|nr:hypothetical protein [Solirubrobacteraceae bacterium]
MERSDELAPHLPGLAMWPGVLKRALVVVACGALTVALAACESTESESAKIEREASKSREAEPGALKLGAINKSVRVSDATLLSAGARKAVAVKLTSTSARDQRQLPVLVEVTAAGGKIAYTNQIGVEPALQHISQLGSHASAWWVDDQVLVNQTTRAVRVRVGTGKRPSHRASPLLSAKLAHVGGAAGASSVSGVLVNHSRVAQKHVPVFVVALRGGKVVAAGRALVASLAGREGASAPFQVTLVGSTAGAKIELTAVATAS